MSPGTLFFVVGPSGSGKDTLIDGARAALSPGGRYVFARRVITRPAGSAGEDHEPADEATFAARESAGDFLISWSAHGLRYGIPRQVMDVIESGRHVVANGSRAVIGDLARRVKRLQIMEVWAPEEVLAARIAGRGREGAAAIRERLARTTPPLPDGATAVRIVNDASPESGIRRFVAALEEAGRAAA